ncbi:uncharacterized protein BCR38DRAFT_523922 [Pseudomassariella vexata]|uniref:Uncharacterized protein n=1 Tax=Pseudomassariella vexata TaxID=1141098 RepID=A0A1Y2E201_9PEZI|nr:uncharacterized protein BCR38DRAFT_523922 [Pseudomassariella vexata]ORY65477.1 hypothetical protein BCR38DRAFT_523922 [Pseudomassariella vexata]
MAHNQVTRKADVDWAAMVDVVEEQLTNFPVGFQPQKYTSQIQYLVDEVYGDIISPLNAIHAHNCQKPFKSQPPEQDAWWDSLYDRLIAILPIFDKHLRDLATENESTVAEWIPVLSKRYDNLAPMPYSDEVNQHARDMRFFLYDNKIPPSAVWQSGQLVANNDFKETFEKFLELGHENPPAQDAAVKSLVRRSQSLLRDALQTVRLHHELAAPPPALFDKHKSPTYVDHSCTDPAFFYGLEQRAGALNLKRRLGGEVSAEDSAKEKQARAVKTKGKEKAKAGQKRSASSRSGRSATKRKRIAVSQSEPTEEECTLEDVDALIQTLRYQAGLNKVKPSAGNSPIMETVGLRPDTLKCYKRALRDIIDKCASFYAEMEDGSKDTDWLLDRLEKEITETRDIIEEYLEFPDDQYSNKQSRISAFHVKYLRSMHLRVAIASSSQRQHESWVSMIEDWVLYERAWNGADVLALRRNTRGTLKNRQAYLDRIADRNTHIEEWTERLEALCETETESTSSSDDDNETKHDDNRLITTKYGTLDPYTLYLPNIFCQWGGIRQREAYLYDYDPVTNERIGYDPEKSGLTPGLDEAFAAGGPPEYQKLPKETVYEKLQYMFVITHWRCLQVLPLLLEWSNRLSWRNKKSD